MTKVETMNEMWEYMRSRQLDGSFMKALYGPDLQSQSGFS